MTGLTGFYLIAGAWFTTLVISSVIVNIFVAQIWRDARKQRNFEKVENNIGSSS